MKFNDFLQKYQEQTNYKTVSKLYGHFGSKRALGITERTFRAVLSGQLHPTIHTFNAIFKQLPGNLRKDALSAFFKSSLTEDNSSAIVAYLNESLKVSFNEDTQSLWSTGREAYFFSEKQLRYLSSSNEVVRIYTHIVLTGATKESIFRSDQKDILKELVALDIIRYENGIYEGSGNLYRLPHQDHSPKELVAPANQFILKHLDSFLAKEGAPGEQELGFSIHTCRKRDADAILNQMKYFKRWVQNFGLKEDRPDEVGFVWMDFARIINRGRDY